MASPESKRPNTSDSPNKASLRRIQRSVYRNRKAGDDMLDAVVEMQAAMNALLAKLDADAVDTGGDADYEASLAVSEIDPDAER